MPKPKQPEPKPDSSVTPQGRCAPARREPHAGRDLSTGRFRPYELGEKIDIEGKR